jgi:hypothetical protein
MPTPQDIYIVLCYLTAAWQNRIRSGLSEQREKLKEKGFKSVKDFMWCVPHTKTSKKIYQRSEKISKDSSKNKDQNYYRLERHLKNDSKEIISTKT